MNRIFAVYLSPCHGRRDRVSLEGVSRCPFVFALRVHHLLPLQIRGSSLRRAQTLRDESVVVGVSPSIERECFNTSYIPLPLRVS